jgi:hypothetical protein
VRQLGLRLGRALDEPQTLEERQPLADEVFRRLVRVFEPRVAADPLRQDSRAQKQLGGRLFSSPSTAGRSPKRGQKGRSSSRASS